MKNRLLTRLNLVRIRTIKRIRLRRARYVSIESVEYRPSRSVLTRLRSFRYWRRFVAVAIVVGLAVWFVTQSNVFNITSLQFEIDNGMERFPVGEVQESVQQQLVGSNILFIDPGEIENSLLDHYRVLRSVKVYRELPNKVVIS